MAAQRSPLRDAGGRLLAWRPHPHAGGFSLHPTWPIPVERADLAAYAGTLLLMVLTALPFLLATVDDARVGLSALPAASAWEPVGRARALATAGLFPFDAGTPAASPLWTWSLLIPYRLLSWTGLPIGALAKLLGWLAAAAGMLAMYSFVTATAGRRWPGVVLLVLLALDPTLAFGRLSGSEAPLAFALAGAAVLALARGHMSVLAWLLGAETLVRPDGVVLALLVVVSIAAERLWQRGNLSNAPEWELMPLIRLALPTLAALALWGAYGLVVAATPLPPLFADPAASPAGPVAGLRALWRGFLADQPAFAFVMVFVTIGALAGATSLYVRRWGVRGVVPALLPFALLASALSGAAGQAAPWGYDLRRLAEPALPWCLAALALGLAAAGERIELTRASRSEPSSGRAMPLGRVAGLLPLVLWAVNLIAPWVAAPGEYVWGATMVSELPVAAGEWLTENAPPDARVALVPGAEPVRASAEQPFIGLPRLQRDDLSMLARRGAEYLVAPPGGVASGWAHAREAARFALPELGGRPARELVVYRLDWKMPESDPAQPAALALDGYQVLDSLDVGDAASETGHFYAAATPGAPTRAELQLPVGWLADDGRAQPIGRGGESFTLAARPGRDLLLGVRYDGGSRGVLRVELERESFEWRLRECVATLCEDGLVLPGGLVRAPNVRLTVTFGAQPGAPSPLVTTFRYWSLVRA